MNLVCCDLENQFVRLEPLSEAHRDGLHEAAHTGINWAVYPQAMTGNGFAAWFEGSQRIHESRREMIFAVRDARTGRIAGSSRFLNIVPEHARAEIGGTWYARPAQGTAINPACKLLMMQHAFSSGANRVEFKVDSRNAHSRAAVLKLGAREEGILRRHMINHDGHVRDSVYYSVLTDEWPLVREGLLARLD